MSSIDSAAIKQALTIPQPTKDHGQLYWAGYRVDEFQCRLLGIAPPRRSAPLKLVGVREFAERMGWSERTLRRRIRESRQAAAAENDQTSEEDAAA